MVNLHRLLVYTLIGLAGFAALLVIMSIWGVDLSLVIYKMLATVVVLILLVGFLMVVKEDFNDHKRLKDQNYLD